MSSGILVLRTLKRQHQAAIQRLVAYIMSPVVPSCTVLSLSFIHIRRSCGSVTLLAGKKPDTGQYESKPVTFHFSLALLAFYTMTDLSQQTREGPSS